MPDLSSQAWILATAATAALFAGPSGSPDQPRSQSDTGHGDPVKFAAPRRLMAGDAFMGQGRLYPSPAVRDMNGDGHHDVVLGDLMGRVTVAYGKGDGTFGADENLLKADGKPLKFHNW